MCAQMQLLKMALDKNDVVYTPDWVAKDMVDFFKPSGRILEPCKGDGVFLKYLPSAEWCEIQEGKDFFAWNTPVDWVFGNPPYKIYHDWLRHSFSISKNVVYLLPTTQVFNSYYMLRDVYKWGGVMHLRVYGTGSRLGFPFGFSTGAVHYVKDYSGAINISMWESGNLTPHALDGATRAEN